jgi:hypothetical protein
MPYTAYRPYAVRVLTVAAVLSCVASIAAGEALNDVRSRGTLRWGGDVQGGEPYATRGLRTAV